MLTGGQNPTPEMEEYLKQRLMSIMQCTSWVCAGTFDNHEWVLESTITEQEEVVGKDLDYEICIQRVAQWCMLWFSAPTRLKSNTRKGSKNQEVPRSCGHSDCRRDL